MLLLLACSANTAKAQLSHPHFISLNMGINIPISDYKDLDQVALGNANSGLFYSVEAGAYFSKFIGLGVNLGAFSNTINDEDIVNQLKRDFSEDDQFTVNSKNWSHNYLMVGPYLTLGTEKLMVDFKVLGGIMNSEKPLIKIESTTSDIALSRSNETSSNAFGLNYGVHLRIKLIGTLGLRLNAEGFMSSQEFNTKVQNVDTNGDLSIRSEVLNQDIQAINIGAGLALNF